MKRKELIRYLRSRGCEFLREGAEAFLVVQSCIEQEIFGLKT